MFDFDLALLFESKTKVINQALKRNIERFPEDFAFQLSEKEWENLRSQIVTSSSEWGGRRYPPFVFSEHGIVMLANVLKNPIAVNISIQIVRVFVSLRQMALDYTDIERKIYSLEQKYDKKFLIVFDSIRDLLRKTPSLDPERKKIGLKNPKDDPSDD